jgi:hypothetical protein
MSDTLTAAIITACLCGAVLLGTRIRRRVEHHLSAEIRDTVKVAAGLIATMSMLLLGMLVSSAKNSYETVRSEVIQLAAEITFLDRVLNVYGPDAASVRAQLHTVVEGLIREMSAGEDTAPADNAHGGDALYDAIQSLSPRDERQRALKDQAVNLTMELGRLAALIRAQSLASIPGPLLVFMVLWLGIILFSFSLCAPARAAATLVLIVSACSLAGAILLILEMDQPFSGLIHISSEPMINALNQIGK